MKTYSTLAGLQSEERIAGLASTMGNRKAAIHLGMPKSTVGDIRLRCIQTGRIDSGGKKLVVIPDAHAHPEYNNDRFTLLGRYIEDAKPDYLVCIGDWADMPSLSSYDRGTRGFEGRRYHRDIDHSVDAMELMMDEISDDTLENMQMDFTLGNHEDRINRMVNSQAEFDGTHGIHELALESYGWNVHKFLKPVVIEGIAFAHFFASGVAGRPISGVNVGSTLCNKLHMSAMQGHSHIYNHAEAARPDGQKIFGMSVGCFAHPNMVEGWNQASEHLWWRGVVELDQLDGKGYYDKISGRTLRGMELDYG